MSLKIKAKERKFKVGKYADTFRYVMVPDLYTSLTQSKVVKEAALRSGVSEGVMSACWDAAGEVIKSWCTEGHAVALPGLGTMRFGLSAKSVADVNDVKSSLIRTRRIVFTPAVELKDELKATKVVITCYDRDGNVVKRVTSDDDGTVEEPDNNDNTGENDGGNQSSGSQNSGSENQGGSQNQGGSSSVAAPTISGTTPFDDSTQVTISGPAGASIKYTTNGIDPTATYGNDYEEPITLNASATVKAVAIIDGVASEVATKAFVKNGSQGGGGEEGM